MRKPSRQSLVSSSARFLAEQEPGVDGEVLLEMKAGSCMCGGGGGRDNGLGDKAFLSAQTLFLGLVFPQNLQLLAPSV